MDMINDVQTNSIKISEDVVSKIVELAVKSVEGVSGITNSKISFSSIFDKKNGLWYELQGDYYIPCLTLPTEKEHKPIGLWGQRHKRYLQEHKRAVYTTLLTSGKLNRYLADIDEQAAEMMFRLVEQMAGKEGVTEQLKAENSMLWVGRMNEIQARAREIVNIEIIYA